MVVFFVANNGEEDSTLNWQFFINLTLTLEINDNNNKWSFAKKVVFLFIMCYTLLYIFPFFYDKIVIWVGKYILHMQVVKIEDNGSGDTTFHYVRFLTFLVFSAVFTALIVLFDKKRSNYYKLMPWLFFGVRHYLFFFMLVYGFAKVFNRQFPELTPFILDKTCGELSPMNLLWVFMGYSKPYAVFSGAMEVIGGILLFFRRTTILGALIVLGVMCNVTMINFCYDVPVKLFSSHLIFFSLILLAPNAKQLFDFFILNRKVELYNDNLSILPRNESTNFLKLALMALFFSAIFFWKAQRMNESPAPSLFGTYKVETFVINKDTLPPIATDSVRWKKLYFGKSFSAIVSMSDKSEYYTMNIYTIDKNAEMIPEDKKSKKIQFNYTKNKTFLTLSGYLGSDSLNVKLTKIDDRKYMLINRGFHWVNEYPINN